MLAEKQPPSWPHGPRAAAHALQNSSSVVLKNPAPFFHLLFRRSLSERLLQRCMSETEHSVTSSSALLFSFSVGRPVRRLIRFLSAGALVSRGPVAPSKRLGGALWSRVSPEFSACAGTEAPTVKQLFERRCDVLSSRISCVCFVSLCVSQIRPRCWRPLTPWRAGCSSCRAQRRTARLWCERSVATGGNTWRRQVRPRPLTVQVQQLTSGSTLPVSSAECCADADAPRSGPLAATMTPNSTPAPGGPASPQQSYLDRTQGSG